MARSAVQLYTLRSLDESLPEIIRRVGDTGYDGIEYANRIRDADTESVRTALEAAEIESVAAHVGLGALDALDEVVAFYRDLGTDRLVVPYLDASHFESRETVVETARKLTTYADEVADRGASLYYHNHDHEFTMVDGRPAFEHLVELAGDSLDFELDLGWAAAAGADPVEFLDEWGDRVSLVHLSDADESRSPTEVGDGMLDVDACASAVNTSGVEWAMYEHDEPTDPLSSVVHGADVLSRF